MVGVMKRSVLDEVSRILFPVERSSWLGPGRTRRDAVSLGVLSQCFCSSQPQSTLAVAPALPKQRAQDLMWHVGTRNAYTGPIYIKIINIKVACAFQRLIPLLCSHEEIWNI